MSETPKRRGAPVRGRGASYLVSLDRDLNEWATAEAGRRGVTVQELLRDLARAERDRA